MKGDSLEPEKWVLNYFVNERSGWMMACKMVANVVTIVRKVITAARVCIMGMIRVGRMFIDTSEGRQQEKCLSRAQDVGTQLFCKRES